MDTIINLKRKRAEQDGTLSVTGRDVDESVYKVIFTEGAKWQAAGDDLADAARMVTEDRLGERMRAVQAAVNTLGSITAHDVAILLEMPEPTARQYLARLCRDHGLIERISLGLYGPVTESHVSRDEDVAAPMQADADAA